MVEFDDSTYSSCTRADKDCKLNLGSICKWIVDKCGKMTVQSLTAQLNETFATRIPVLEEKIDVANHRITDLETFHKPTN